MEQLAGIEVLFEDAALLVINKPAGLATLPDGYNPSLPHIKSVLENEAGRLWIVHRLDKDTSGVLLLARTADAHRSLNTQFEQHQVSKVYHAFIAGNPPWKKKTVDLPLRANGDRQHRTVVDLQQGKPAITHLKVLERFNGYSFLQAEPETGRTHQIRAHLAALGFSLIGDKLYRSKPPDQDSGIYMPTGEFLINFGLSLKGIGLHSRSLEISHPISGERMKFVAAYPADWAALFQQLRTTGRER